MTKLTQTQVKAAIREAGMSAHRTAHDEWRVTFPYGELPDSVREDTAYYTDGDQDAIDTAKRMRAERERLNATPVVTLPIREALPSQLAGLSWIVVQRTDGGTTTLGAFLAAADATRFADAASRMTAGRIGVGHFTHGWVDMWSANATHSENVDAMLFHVANCEGRAKG